MTRGCSVGGERYSVLAAFDIHGFVCWDIKKVQGGGKGMNTVDSFRTWVAVTLVRLSAFGKKV